MAIESLKNPGTNELVDNIVNFFERNGIKYLTFRVKGSSNKNNRTIPIRDFKKFCLANKYAIRGYKELVKVYGRKYFIRYRQA